MKRTRLKRDTPLRSRKPGKAKSKRKPPGDRTLQSEWSRIIRARAGFRCVFCGRGHPSHRTFAHHLIFKSQSKFYKWHPENGLCLCFQCHKYNVEWSPHQNRPGFLDKLAECAPDKHAWLMSHRNETHPEYRLNRRAVRNDLSAVWRQEEDYRKTCHTLGVDAEGER